jgi:hypothetical protein
VTVVPLPTDATINLVPPAPDEVDLILAGVLGAVAPLGGPTVLQRSLFAALSASMTGHEVDTEHIVPIGPDELADVLRYRSSEFRLRIIQLMLLGELVLTVIPPEVSANVDRYVGALAMPDEFTCAGRDHAEGSLGFALVDFARNGYSAGWSNDQFPLHTSRVLDDAWQRAPDDPVLAAQWHDLAELPPGSLGRGVHAFYRNRGFSVPGTQGSAPPLLAQHDWVHVVADYGAAVDNEVEVFGLIARSSPNPQAFALLAMVIGLFETGAVARAAGDFFEADVAHLSRDGMTTRLADAFLRGAMCGRDLMTLDWFTLAPLPVSDVREELGIVPKSPGAIRSGSATPWEIAGYSEFQLKNGKALALTEDRDYRPFEQP